MGTSDYTNAERQRRFKARRKAKLNALGNASVTPQVIEKPTEVTPPVTPSNASKKCPPYNPPINTQTQIEELFPESPLSIQEKTSARARFQNAVLTEPMLDYGLRWGPFNPTVEEVERAFEGFKSHYGSHIAHDCDAEIWPMWQGSVQRWYEREMKKYEVGTVAHTIREKRQVEAALGAMANGQVRSGNGSGMRQSNLQDVPSPNRYRPESVGGGTGNVVHGAFGRGSQERDKYGYPKAQKVADSGAPRRIADGRGRAD